MKLLAGIACVALLLGGCQSTSKSAASPGMINSTCPFSGGQVGPGAVTADWKGETVGFCCGGCAARWHAWSDDQRDDYIAAQQ